MYNLGFHELTASNVESYSAFLIDTFSNRSYVRFDET